MIKVLKRWRGLSCEEALRQLQSFLDGETDGITASEIADHLDVCERCDIEATVFRSIKQSLRTMDRSVDPELLARLERFAQSVVNSDADN